VECIPIRNKAVASNQMLCRKKPALANTMMPISNTLTRRMICDFSNLSASCPAVAENRKKGRIKRPGNIVVRLAPSKVVRLAVWNATSVINAVLNTLSLNAPRNCVKKNGRKRLSCINSN
jgi:hypothetical protein